MLRLYKIHKLYILPSTDRCCIDQVICCIRRIYDAIVVDISDRDLCFRQSGGIPCTNRSAGKLIISPNGLFTDPDDRFAFDLLRDLRCCDALLAADDDDAIIGDRIVQTALRFSFGFRRLNNQPPVLAFFACK